MNYKYIDPLWKNRWLGFDELLSTEQKVKIAIQCAILTHCPDNDNDPLWLKWAENWLSGKDRTSAAAHTAKYIAYKDYYLEDSKFKAAESASVYAQYPENEWDCWGAVIWAQGVIDFDLLKLILQNISEIT